MYTHIRVTQRSKWTSLNNSKLIYSNTIQSFNFRVPGGSSGGEGSLISSKCSPAGIGGDIGGSIRIPAAYSGIYGFKPSYCRTNYIGHEPWSHKYPYDHEASIYPVSGPLGRSVDDLITLEKILISDYFIENDAQMPPLPFDDSIVEEYANKKKLKIGYITYDGCFQACSASIEAVEKSVKLLNDAGHELIKIDDTFFDNFIEVYGRIVFHGGSHYTNGLQGEPQLDQYELMALPEMIPECIKPFVTTILNLLKMKRESLLVKLSGNKSNKSFSTGCHLKAALLNKQMEKWKELKLDCFIMPATGLPPLKHGHSKELSLSCFYTAILNAWDYPAGIIPNVVRVTKDHLKIPYNDPKYPDDDIVKKARETLEGSDKCSNCDCPKENQGMPICIQVVTMSGEEEKCLGIMKQVDKIIHNK